MNSKRALSQSINQEVAQAILRGEVNYAYTLQSMDLVRTKDSIVHVDRLNENQRLGFDHFVRRLRDAV